MKKTQLTAQQEHDLTLIMEETGMSRKSAIRKLQRRAKLQAKEAKTARAAKPVAARLNPQPMLARRVPPAYRTSSWLPDLPANSSSRCMARPGRS